MASKAPTSCALKQSALGKVQTYTANLGKTLRETNKCKGRLLYYFPPKAGRASIS